MQILHGYQLQKYAEEILVHVYQKIQYITVNLIWFNMIRVRGINVHGFIGKTHLIGLHSIVRLKAEFMKLHRSCQSVERPASAFRLPVPCFLFSLFILQQYCRVCVASSLHSGILYQSFKEA